MAESRTSPRRIEAAERARRALELRAAGHSFDQIAQLAGYRSRQAAHSAVERALLDPLGRAAEVVRLLEAERLERLHEAHWPAALGGSPKSSEIVLAVAARRAKLLGLDAPVRSELTGRDGFPLAPIAPPVFHFSFDDGGPGQDGPAGSDSTNG
jgi:hypothetical protein